MAEQFILIPGRSSRQGVALNEGKCTDSYLDETSILRMNPDDMERLGLSTGDDVRMWNDIGEVVVSCLNAKDECPTGLVFVCYGDKSSQLMPGETHGSGMPDSKGLDVFVQAASLPKEVEEAANPEPEPKPVVPAETEPIATGNPASRLDEFHSAAEPFGKEDRGPGLTGPAATILLIVLVTVLVVLTNLIG